MVQLYADAGLWKRRACEGKSRYLGIYERPRWTQTGQNVSMTGSMSHMLSGRSRHAIAAEKANALYCWGNWRLIREARNGTAAHGEQTVRTQAQTPADASAGARGVADLLLPASLGAAGRDAVPGMRRAELAKAIVTLNLSASAGGTELGSAGN